jgi:hypothetical protein
LKPPTRYAVYVLYALALPLWDGRKDIPKSRSPPRPGQHLTFTYPDVLPILVLSIAAQLKKKHVEFLRLHLSIYNYLLNKNKDYKQVRNKLSRSMCRRKKNQFISKESQYNLQKHPKFIQKQP